MGSYKAEGRTLTSQQQSLHQKGQEEGRLPEPEGQKVRHLWAPSFEGHKGLRWPPMEGGCREKSILMPLFYSQTSQIPPDLHHLEGGGRGPVGGTRDVSRGGRVEKAEGPEERGEGAQHRRESSRAEGWLPARSSHQDTMCAQPQAASRT